MSTVDNCCRLLSTGILLLIASNPVVAWIQSSLVFPARLFSMCLRSVVSAEPLWIALRSDWLSMQMAAPACDGESHSSAMRMAAFSSSYDEVVAAPRCCFERRVGGLAGSPSVTTIPAAPFSVPAVAEPSV